MHRAAADHQFELKVAAAIKALRRVLTAEKQRPVLASIAPHDFVDKYALAEQAPSLSAFEYLSSAFKSAHSHPNPLLRSSQPLWRRLRWESWRHWVSSGQSSNRWRLR